MAKTQLKGISYTASYCTSRNLIGIGRVLRWLYIIVAVFCVLAAIFRETGYLALVAIICLIYGFVQEMAMAALGYTLSAVVDTAVNTSPLLDDEAKTAAISESISAQ